jgi:hypothetical protein
VEVGLPLSQHGGLGAPPYSPPGFAAIMVLATEHSFYSGRSLWQLILGGAFERFPALRLVLVLVETEAWWIAPMMDHLDQRARRSNDWSEFAEYMGFDGGFKRLPGEYWQANCYAGISPFHPAQVSIDDLGSLDVQERVGFSIYSDNAMFGVDYPHFESIYPATMEQVAKLTCNPHVTDADARKIL